MPRGDYATPLAAERIRTVPDRPPLTEIDHKRIAIIKPSALGDIVHALPVLTALRERFANSHITWVVNRTYEPLLRGHPDLDAVLPFDRGARAAVAAMAALRFARRLRNNRFDLVLDLQGLFRTGLMAAATGASRRVGLSSAREGATHFYTDVVEDDFSTHAVDRYWRVATALGAGMYPKQFRVPLDPAAVDWARDKFAQLPRPWLVVGVGARWLTKRWPPEHFATLIEAAQSEFGGTAIFVGTRDDAALSQVTIKALSRPSLDLTGHTTLPQLAAILALADVMLANDTGPLHLAAALGRPVAAPYTCTDVARHGPYGAFAGTVSTTVVCRASYVRTCAHLSCMSELTPERLRGPLFEALSRCRSLSRSA
jgi:lipopolysaccharide heptosyltransferase I